MPSYAVRGHTYVAVQVMVDAKNKDEAFEKAREAWGCGLVRDRGGRAVRAENMDIELFPVDSIEFYEATAGEEEDEDKNKE